MKKKISILLNINDYFFTSYYENTECDIVYKVNIEDIRSEYDEFVKSI